MDRKYQIFISSTYEDLKEQRDAVVKAVLKMGHLPVGMEMFNAADQQQWEIIKRHIDNSDYYVLIVANRYGTIGPQGISYTQQEYEYAVEKQIPCLGFLLQKGTLWPDTMMETGAAKKKLDALKKKIGERPVNFWDSTDKLALQVFASLSEAITLSPRFGWVRASETTGPQVAEELARLSRENAELTARLQVQPTDELTTIERAVATAASYTRVDEGDLRLGFHEVFIAVCELQSKPSEGEILMKFRSEVHKITRDILAELALMGLLNRETVPVKIQDRVFGHHVFWRLTSVGQKIYVRLRYYETSEN